VAAVQEGRFFVGIELEPEYHRIAQARIAHAEQRQMEMAV
jgi:DNA modification methylase